MATSLNKKKCCRSPSSDEWQQVSIKSVADLLYMMMNDHNQPELIVLSLYRGLARSEKKCFVSEYCWQHSRHKYVLSAVIVLCQMFSSPLRLFLAYTAQCYRSYYVHTVCSHSLLNMHHCGSSRLNVTCPNDHGCTNQQPVRSWQHSGSHARISAAAHTVRSCSLRYLGWLCVTVCCMLLLTAYIKNPLYGG